MIDDPGAEMAIISFDSPLRTNETVYWLTLLRTISYVSILFTQGPDLPLTHMAAMQCTSFPRRQM